MSDLERAFSQEAIAEAGAVPSFSGGYPDITDCEAFAVDDPEIADPDDAISIRSFGKFYRLGVHISMVSWFIRKGSALDREAMARAVSVYFPGRSIYMFPEGLIREKLSLSEKRTGPVLSLFADLDDDGTLIRVEMKLAQLRLSARFTYPELAGLLKSEPRIRQLYSLSLALSERRAMSGGNLIPIPYLKASEADGEMLFERIDPESPEQLMITEPMILYNHLVSKFLATKGVPGAFRYQPEPHGRPPSPHNPLYPVKALYALKRSHLSPEPKPHRGLGFSSYLQATSPLRRFTDLINQRQALALLEGTEPPYTTEELAGLLPDLEEREADSRKTQRDALYAAVMANLEGKIVPGVVSNRRRGGMVFLPDYIVQVPVVEPPEGMKEGLRVRVKIKDGKAYRA